MRSTGTVTCCSESREETYEASSWQREVRVVWVRGVTGAPWWVDRDRTSGRDGWERGGVVCEELHVVRSVRMISVVKSR